MGLKLRKSINLGGGFKINLSKSGVGYSWGTKGFRLSKTSKGKVRYTSSVPGTGVSYTQDFGSKKKKKGNIGSQTQSKQQYIQDEYENYTNVHEFENAKAETLVSEGMEEMLVLANKALSLWKIKNILFWCILICGGMSYFIWLCFIPWFVYHRYLKKKIVIDLDYTFEDEQEALVNERMKPLVKIAQSKKVWRISERRDVKDRKKSTGGAVGSVKRHGCKAKLKTPFPFKSNAISVCFKSGKETLLFMPDKLFIIQKYKLGVLSYSDIKTSVTGRLFVETDKPPKDAKIVYNTWEHVNKNGGADKRYSNNKQYPVCLYGEMTVTSDVKNINSVIMFSNSEIE